MKIEKKELESIRDLSLKISNQKNELLECYLQLEEVTSKKDKLFLSLKKTEASFKSLISEVKEKYGDVSIRLQDGEIVKQGEKID